MQKLFTKIFDNKSLFCAAPFIYILSYIIYDVCYEADWQDFVGYYYLVCNILYFVIMVGIVISFFKHEKNVMKGLVAAMLFEYFSYSLTDAAYYVIVDRSDITYSCFCAAMAVLSTLLFINHFRLAADHAPKPVTMRFNQLLIIALMLVEIAWELYCHSVSDTYSLIYVVTNSLCNVCVLYQICAVETKVDYFKTLRQEKQKAESAEA